MNFVSSYTYSNIWPLYQHQVNQIYTEIRGLNGSEGSYVLDQPNDIFIIILCKRCDELCLEQLVPL